MAARSCPTVDPESVSAASDSTNVAAPTFRREPFVTADGPTIEVATNGLKSAEEDLKLSQEKYNVGSGTILELIDAQVALQRARSNQVQALTEARVADALVARVRGQRF